MSNKDILFYKQDHSAEIDGNGDAQKNKLNIKNLIKEFNKTRNIFSAPQFREFNEKKLRYG